MFFFSIFLLIFMQELQEDSSRRVNICLPYKVHQVVQELLLFGVIDALWLYFSECFVVIEWVTLCVRPL